MSILVEEPANFHIIRTEVFVSWDDQETKQILILRFLLSHKIRNLSKNMIVVPIPKMHINETLHGKIEIFPIKEDEIRNMFTNLHKAFPQTVKEAIEKNKEQFSDKYWLEKRVSFADDFQDLEEKIPSISPSALNYLINVVGDDFGYLFCVFKVDKNAPTDLALSFGVSMPALQDKLFVPLVQSKVWS